LHLNQEVKKKGGEQERGEINVLYTEGTNSFVGPRKKSVTRGAGNCVSQREKGGRENRKGPDFSADSGTMKKPP